ncbi:MAG: hypothetical protein NC045_08655, partial [Bacteroides sp.]|nr:hypothetical protein [Bacteroides sp.]
MKKFLNISLYALVTLIGFAFTACDDDDDSGVAKAVLASTGNLTYEATSAPGQIITVYSDATWTCEHPDWVTVEPETGSGTTEVRITVADNLRDGTPDNPRKADVVFKGVTKASEAHVIVRQDGDKFRDVLPITIEQMEQNEEESVAIINNLTVVAPLSGAFIATDGTNNVYVTTNETKAAGDVVTVYGEKAVDSNNLSVVKADYFTDGGTAATLPAPVAITGADVDGKTFGNRQYLTVTGIVDGKNVNVDGAETIHVVVTDAAAGLDWGALNGHEVTLRGFYCGTASPAFNMIAESVDDLGIHEVIYYSEDFEWLEDWAVGAGVGKTVEENNLDATATALTSVKDPAGSGMT